MSRDLEKKMSLPTLVILYLSSGKMVFLLQEAWKQGGALWHGEERAKVHSGALIKDNSAISLPRGKSPGLLLHAGRTGGWLSSSVSKANQTSEGGARYRWQYYLISW